MKGNGIMFSVLIGNTRKASDTSLQEAIQRDFAREPTSSHSFYISASAQPCWGSIIRNIIFESRN